MKKSLQDKFLTAKPILVVNSSEATNTINNINTKKTPETEFVQATVTNLGTS
jgi:hypothetical protein